MNPKELLKQKTLEAQELRKKALETPADFTNEDADKADKLVEEIGELTKQIDRMEDVKRKISELPSLEQGTASSDENHDDDPKDIKQVSHSGIQVIEKTIGEQFIDSPAYKAFRDQHPRGVAKGAEVNIQIGAEDLQGGVTSKAILRRPTTGNARAVRTNEVDDLVYRAPRRLLDVITRGTTNLPWFQYRQIIGKTNNAAIVPEASSTTLTTTASGYKPVSDLTTTTAEAREFTYADGMEVTNQELADDGIMASIIDSTLRENLEIQVENVLLNSVASADAPAGILNTTGVLQQAFVTDAQVSLRKAITKLRVTSNAPIRGVLMNPEDDEAWDLLKDTTGNYLYGSGPYQMGPSTAWSYERIVSQAIPVGKALIGDFSTIHLLQYSPLQILAFNQHADFARRNLTYIRAEERALQLVRNAARLCVVQLKATV